MDPFANETETFICRRIVLDSGKYDMMAVDAGRNRLAMLVFGRPWIAAYVNQYAIIKLGSEFLMCDGIRDLVVIDEFSKPVFIFSRLVNWIAVCVGCVLVYSHA